MMKNETKRERFERLLKSRKANVLHAIDQVFKLSRYPQVYEFSDDDFQSVKQELMEAIASAKWGQSFRLNEERDQENELL